LGNSWGNIYVVWQTTYPCLKKTGFTSGKKQDRANSPGTDRPFTPNINHKKNRRDAERSRDHFIFDASMKKLLMMIWPVVLLTGCSKSGGGIKPNAAVGLSGTYTVYKQADTAFNNSLRADGIYDITVETLYGDTVYSGFGSGHPPHAGVNIIQNYTPGMIADTLIFKSATTGIESNLSVTTPITYSLSTGAFNDGVNDPTIHSKLTQIDASTIEIVSFQQQNGYVSDVVATFYKKE
jgi:hypothetical protein